MKRAAVLILIVLLLAGCGEKTPLEVIEGTWMMYFKNGTKSRETNTFDTQKMICFQRSSDQEREMPFTVITQGKDSITLSLQVRPHIKTQLHFQILDKDTLRVTEDGEDEVTLKRDAPSEQ